LGKVLDLVSKFNCISNSAKIDKARNDIASLEDKVYEKEYINLIVDNLNKQINKHEAYMEGLVAKVNDEMLGNKEAIRENHNLLYSKNETMNETLRKEIHTTSLSLAEIRGFLRRDKRWGG
jgi:hypothetical protein